MRVALLTNFIPPYRVSLYEALMRDVGDLRVFISTVMEANRSWQADHGSLDVVVQRGITLRRMWRGRDFAESYEQHVPVDTLFQLAAYKPDVIISAEFGARSVQAALYATLRRVPLVLWATVSDHLDSQRGALRQSIRAQLLPRAAAVLVNGESGARYISRFDVPLEKIVRVPYTTDMRPFLDLAVDRPVAAVLRLLYVGALTSRKGADLLLDAVARAGRPLALTLVGDGPMRAQLESRVLPQHVTVNWVGNVPYAELPRYFEDADVCVMPSRGDEWGIVVNEALAAGVPVLGSRYAQAVEELVRNDTNGWTFTPGEDELAARLAVIAPDTSMRRAARNSVARLTPDWAASVITKTVRDLGG